MTDHLRILSANLWAGAADPAALARQLEELAIDVCAVQELDPKQARAIAEVLPHGKLEPTLDHHGMGIALRHPAEMRTLPLPIRNGRVVRLDPLGWPQLDHPLEVMNLHIQAPHVVPPWGAVTARRGQMDGVMRYLDDSPHPSRVVVGDLNATPIWPVYRRMAERLRDAAQLHAESRSVRPRATWGPTARGPRLLRIDHAFIDGVRIESLEVIRVAGSDHSALLIDLVPAPNEKDGTP